MFNQHKWRYSQEEWDKKVSLIGETNLAYVAGLFDGEGCITLCKIKRKANRSESMLLQLNLSNTYLEALEFVKSLYGFGSIVKHTKKEGRKQGYSYVLNAKSAEMFLSSIEKYSIIKIGQIRIALKFRKIVQQVPFQVLSQNYKDEVNKLADGIRALNGRNYKKETALKI